MLRFVLYLPYLLLVIPKTSYAQTIDSGDTAWMLTSTVLVLFMTLPGLALFYAGLVRRRNVLSVLMQCFTIACIASLVWIIYGYSLAFKGDGLFIGDMTLMMGNFYEAYNYSRNFNLPLEFVIEDNGKSVYTDTKKTWNIKKINYPKDVFYYKFKLEYPHHGTGKWVSF